MNFLKRYWKGEVSLPISYWVVSWVVNIFLVVLVTAIDAFISTRPTFNPIVTFLSYSFGVLFLTATIFWQVIGVMRSAINHINNPTKTKAWGYLAIGATLIGLFRTYGVYQQQIVPIFVELYQISFASDPDLPPYKITIVENGQELRIDGGMKYGLLEDVKKALSLAPSVTTINLESMGGRIGVAEDLYNLISQRGLNTVTNGECLSACPYVFAAGKNRWLGINARLGFHSAKLANIPSKELNKENADLLMKIHKEKGIPLSFLKKGVKVSPDKMWFPNRQELRRNNFITSENSPAISSLRDLERLLVSNAEKVRKTLPKKLDQHTTLIDMRIKLNRVTSIHTISKTLFNFRGKTRRGRAIMKQFVIASACKLKTIRDNLNIGIVHEMVYLHPTNKSKVLSFELPPHCS